MDNDKKIKEKIFDMIEKIKEKNILVEVEFQEEKNEFAVFSANEPKSLHYKIIYMPKNFLLKEDNNYVHHFIRFLSSLDSKASKIDYLLRDLDKNADVCFEKIDYNSYFNFTEEKVAINIDSYGDDISKFKELIDVYDENPVTFIRNIVDSNLYYDFNDLMKNGKMKYFKSVIYNVKLQGKKYIVFNTSNSMEKIMYILDEDNKYIDITDERYLKILKKLSLINNL